MARGKKTIRNKNNIATDKPVKPAKTSKNPQGNITSLSNLKQNVLDQIKLSESYVSLILGAIVVLVLSLVFFVFLRGNGPSQGKLPDSDSISPPITKASEKIYILKQDEALWDVAVKFYGDGYRYTEIIGANNLENPDYVPPGTKLIIPNAK
ncbi:MAG: hypothetical protein US51_C0051G0003 [Microgenomates group bacterium GW2011_GWA2_37_6]|nr:MAG: hypothetical protein US51_C0051G0003 [Microgenomates group bacterium GW2011_GWA2_37_6]